MDAFVCIVKHETNFVSLPQELLDIIQKRKQNRLFKFLNEDIIQAGQNYFYLSGMRHDSHSSIPESYNIVKCAVENRLLSDLGLYPPALTILRCREYPELSTPEWLTQLKTRLHLKYNTGFVHCLSQLKRFVGYFKQGDLSRTLQFGYNLGRLQEISGKSDHTIFWQPVERLFLSQDWNGLDAYIDTLQRLFQIGYDHAILVKPR